MSTTKTTFNLPVLSSVHTHTPDKYKQIALEQIDIQTIN